MKVRYRNREADAVPCVPIWLHCSLRPVPNAVYFGYASDRIVNSSYTAVVGRTGVRDRRLNGAPPLRARRCCAAAAAGKMHASSSRPTDPGLRGLRRFIGESQDALPSS